MGKIATGHYAEWKGNSGPGKGPKDVVTGKMAAGGSTLGKGGKLKSMMVWKDTGRKGAY